MAGLADITGSFAVPASCGDGDVKIPWPRIGVDLTAIRLDGRMHRGVVVVFCHSLDYSPLFSSLANYVREALPPSIEYDGVSSDLDDKISSALCALGSPWSEECFSVLQVTDGEGAGTLAVGIGSNSKKQMRAAQVALSVALEMQLRYGVCPEMENAVNVAEQAVRLVFSGLAAVIGASPPCREQKANALPDDQAYAMAERALLDAFSGSTQSLGAAPPRLDYNISEAAPPRLDYNISDKAYAAAEQALMNAFGGPVPALGTAPPRLEQSVPLQARLKTEPGFSRGYGAPHQANGHRQIDSASCPHEASDRNGHAKPKALFHNGKAIFTWGATPSEGQADAVSSGGSSSGQDIMKLLAQPPPPPPPPPAPALKSAAVLGARRPEAEALQIDPGAPYECIEDAYAELRPWGGTHEQARIYLWPYCTACDCWSDVTHIYTKRHLTAAAYEQRGCVTTRTVPGRFGKKVQVLQRNGNDVPVANDRDLLPASDAGEPRYQEGFIERPVLPGAGFIDRSFQERALPAALRRGATWMAPLPPDDQTALAPKKKAMRSMDQLMADMKSRAPYSPGSIEGEDLFQELANSAGAAGQSAWPTTHEADYDSWGADEAPAAPNLPHFLMHAMRAAPPPLPGGPTSCRYDGMGMGQAPAAEMSNDALAADAEGADEDELCPWKFAEMARAACGIK